MFRGLKEFKLVEIEEKVLKFWKESQIFEKAQALREPSGKRFRFFEGPPTANGKPGIHHLLSRAFKDIIPRYKTMRGFFVRRKAGWDTHGLPVEIEVEKELGFKSKQDIEKFGIAEFNEKAKASVLKYKDEWEKLSERIGFWLDFKNPYITYKAEYIESLWWVFKQIAERGLLTQSFKVVPYCPRCQTPLSSHEMGQPGVYKKVKDPSIYIKFALRQRPLTKFGRSPQSTRIKAKEFLLVWTTTPWTLPSNVAVAVNPRLSYTKYKVGKEFWWSYGPPPADNAEVVERVSGKTMIGWQYDPMFKVGGPWLKNNKFFRVYGADFVTTTEGTGLVHIAPAFGEDDMRLIRRYQKNLVGQIPITINEQGMVQKGLPGGGKFVKQADNDIIEHLSDIGLLVKNEIIEHDYPFCWRCGAPTLYFSRFSWFVEMSVLRDKLLKNNQRINWVPEHIKEGRFGEWLKDVKDWAISRDRYWGTPLPIWKCEQCKAIEVAGSLDDLNRRRYARNNFYLLRHGESEHNLKETIAAGPEKDNLISRLTKKGAAQVEKAGKKLLKKLGKSKLDVIFSSPYQRTRQTAEIISKITGAKIVVEERFSEIDCGIFNWRSEKEFQKHFAKPIERFVNNPPGGENLTEVKRRVFKAVLDINSRYEDKNILIISHGDPLWMLEGAMRGLSNEEILKMEYIGIGSSPRKAELYNWPYNLNGELDLHRPYVDSIYLRCRKCRNRMIRVKEVADIWFDSGAMPFAQDYYPFNCAQARNKLNVKDLEQCTDFPADYISEGIDQTRGWFYTLLAIATALELESSYKNVIALGLVLDKNGQKMSKSKGNVVSPWDIVQKYGADVVRWYFYTVNSPSEPKLFNEGDLKKTFNKFLLIVYNSFVFWNTYADKHQSIGEYKFKSDQVLDDWILSRLNETILLTTDNLEKYEVGLAGRALEIFVDDLSRWYIRRSRSRLQKPADKKDFLAASDTLFYCLLELSKLMAPFTPFFADALYKSFGPRKESVHLEDWPRADKKRVNFDLLEKMEEIRRISSLVLALRAEKGIKVRQPLQALEMKSKKLNVRDIDLLEILKDEVNVKEIRWNFGLAEELALNTELTPELIAEGLRREVVRMIQGLRHDADYVPQDKVALMIEASTQVRKVLESKLEFLKKDVNAKSVEFKKSDKFDAELDSKIDNEPIWIGLKKIQNL